jgi:hypothetical protein
MPSTPTPNSQCVCRCPHSCTRPTALSSLCFLVGHFFEALYILTTFPTFLFAAVAYAAVAAPQEAVYDNTMYKKSGDPASDAPGHLM